MSYTGNIIKEAQDNSFFRKVLFTGEKSQLVVMSILPGEDIGVETHEHVEQVLFCESGSGVSVLDGIETPFTQGDVVVVSPGAVHNFKNTGESLLKIYTVYSPANHIDGRIHTTKVEAEIDAEDEAFGETAGTR